MKTEGKPKLEVRMCLLTGLRFPLTPSLSMIPPVARCPLTLPSPPVGERVAEGRVRGFRGPMREVWFRGILSPRERAGVRGNDAAENRGPVIVLLATIWR